MKKLLLLITFLVGYAHAFFELVDLSEHDYELVASDKDESYVYIPACVHTALKTVALHNNISGRAQSLLCWLEQGNVLYPQEPARAACNDLITQSVTSVQELCLANFVQLLDTPDAIVVIDSTDRKKKPKIFSNLLAHVLSVEGNLIVNGLINVPASMNPSSMTGPQGAQGAQGPTGALGQTGNTGPDGFTGFTGFTGNIGATGAIGSTGNTGAPGLSGTNGATGTTGARGATGATGASGVNGFTGFTGLTGPQGATGATGADSIPFTGPSGFLLGLAASYGVFYTTGTGTGIVQTVGPNAAFAFDGSMPVVTPGIINSGTVVTIVSGGVYKINYVIQGVTSSVVGLRINNTINPLTVYAQSSNNSQVIGQAIIRVSDGASIELVNLDTASLDVLNSLGGDRIGAAFSLMIQRLS